MADHAIPSAHVRQCLSELGITNTFPVCRGCRFYGGHCVHDPGTVELVDAAYMDDGIYLLADASPALLVEKIRRTVDLVRACFTKAGHA
eukprot:9868957-Alexandrium_andersonii.AAC.1